MNASAPAPGFTPPPAKGAQAQPKDTAVDQAGAAAPAPAPAGASLVRQLTIEFDTASARFIQTLTNADTVVRRYPGEAQLAFSRGVRAYEKALRAA